MYWGLVIHKTHNAQHTVMESKQKQKCQLRHLRKRKACLPPSGWIDYLCFTEAQVTSLGLIFLPSLEGMALAVKQATLALHFPAVQFGPSPCFSDPYPHLIGLLDD